MVQIDYLEAFEVETGWHQYHLQEDYVSMWCGDADAKSVWSACRARKSPGGLVPAGGLSYQDMAEQLLHKRLGALRDHPLPIHEPRTEVQVKLPFSCGCHSRPSSATTSSSATCRKNLCAL